MPADSWGGAYTLVMSQRDLLSDVRAGGVAGLAGPDEAGPGPNQQRLHRRDGRVQCGGHLLVGETGQLAQQQGRALLLREPLDVLDQPAKGLPGVNPSGRVIHR
jgi:hypothetical protein